MEGRRKAVEELKNLFDYFPDRKQAWDDLMWLTSDTDSYVRWRAADALGSAFSYVPDKKQAWEDLHSLTQDDDVEVRLTVVHELSVIFPSIPNKNQVWEDLIRLTQDKFEDVRIGAAYAICLSLPYNPNKDQVWEVLIQLLKDINISELCVIKILTLISPYFHEIFSHIADKKQLWVWEDLHRLTLVEYASVRVNMANLLNVIFTCIPEIFYYIPDKKAVQDDLHKLSQDENGIIRFHSAKLISAAFPYILDKKQAWNDLLRLIKDVDEDIDPLLGDNIYVRRNAAYALSEAFPCTLDKINAWNDLIRLSQDEYYNVRLYANCSLGRVSIFKAAEAENEVNFKKELEEAIEYFKKIKAHNILMKKGSRKPLSGQFNV